MWRTRLLCFSVVLGLNSHASAQSINPTGRDIDLITPVFQDGRLIGDVALTIGADDALALDAAGTVAMLGERMNVALGEQIVANADANGRVPINVFTEAGAPLSYDPASLTLVYAPTAAALSDSSISLNDSAIRPESFTEPANYAGYVNFFGGVQFNSGDIADDGLQIDDIDIIGAVRAFDVVVEAGARYDEDEARFSRRFTRGVYDFTGSGDRIIAGDYVTPFTGLVESTELLAIAVENTGTLRPFDNLRPLGRTEFQIERTSDVEIYSNGALQERRRLEPGIFDLNDIPLTPGANDISVVVVDDEGRREIARFNQFFDGALLAQGKILYSAALGVVSESGANEPDYEFDRPAVSGNVLYGLTDQITVGAATRASAEQGVIGTSAISATPFGTFALDLGASYSDTLDFGVGAELNWFYDLSRMGDSAFLNDSAITASLGYSSDTFIIGDPLDLNPGVDQNVFDLSIGYSKVLPNDMFLNLNAFHGIAADGANDDRTLLGASLGGVYGDRYSWGIRTSYLIDDSDEDDGFSVGLTLGVRLGENTTAGAFYESRDNSGGVNLRHSKGRGVGSYTASLSTDYNDEDEEVDVDASATYTANRFFASFSHRETYDQQAGDRLGNTALRVGTAIAFADGKVAVGRPVTGSYVIGYPHDSLDGRRVLLGSDGKGSYDARSDGFGPALSSGFGAFRSATVGFDVEDLPLGYDLGTGLIEIEPTYRAGYRVEVGSAASLSVIGLMVDADGEPLQLTTGIARRIDDPEATPLQVFTNRSGRFALLGATPGRYTIAMTGGGTVELTVPAPDGQTSLVQLGEVVVE